jgi:hypothetical protein
MKYKILSHVEPEEWNNRLATCDYSTFFQTAEFLSKKDLDRYPIFIYIYDDTETIQGQLGLIISKSRSGHSTKILKKITKIASKIGGRGSWTSGPIIYSKNKDTRIKVLQTIFLALDEVVSKHKLMILDGYTPPQDLDVDERYLNEFKKYGFKQQNFLTLASDLHEDIGIFWKKIKKNARNEVVKARREGITIKEITTKEELKNYKVLTKKWAKTKGIDITKSDTEKIEIDWLFLKSGIQKFFLAYRQQEILAGLRIGCFNKIAYTHQVLNAYSEIGNTAGPLLTWHAIEWAKNNDMKVYDFSGGEAPPSNKKDLKKYTKQWESLFAYKRKWSGDEISYYHFIKITNKERYKLFRILSKPDTFVRNYKKEHFKKPKK